MEFDRCKSIIDKKGLKMNLSKTKVMVSGAGGGMVVEKSQPFLFV